MTQEYMLVQGKLMIMILIQLGDGFCVIIRELSDNFRSLLGYPDLAYSTNICAVSYDFKIVL